MPLHNATLPPKGMLAIWQGYAYAGGFFIDLVPLEEQLPYANKTQTLNVWQIFTYMKGETWPHSRGNVGKMFPIYFHVWYV